MKSKKTSIFRLGTISLAAVVCAGVAAILPITAKASGDISTVTATMDVGASVKIADNYADMGIRYTYFVSKSDYEILSQYDDVTYGVFIAPSYYNDAFAIANENNVKNFYYWTGKDEPSDKSLEILNANSTSLKPNGDDGYRFDGGVVNMREENLLEEYIGVGYIRYVDDSGEHYIFAQNEEGENNVRSMVYLAQRHSENNPSDDTKLAVYFNDSVTSATTSYTNEYYVKGANGYTLSARETVSDAKVNADATIEPKTIANYKVEENNANNLASGKVYANGKRVFKLYYTFDIPADKQNVEKGLIETSTTKTLSTDFVEGLNYRLYKRFGVDTVTADGYSLKETEVEGFEFDSNGDIDLTSLDGQYVAKAIAGDEVIQTISFDAYNKNNKFEYNNDLSTYSAINENVTYATIENSIVSEANGRTGDYIKTVYTPIAESSNANSHYSGFHLQLAPVHSKAYYELYSGTMLTLDYYIDTTETDSDLDVTASTLSLIRNPGGYGPIDNYANIMSYHAQTNINAWYTAKKPVSWIIDNYDSMVTGKKGSDRSYLMGTCNYLTCSNGNNVKLITYFGNIGIDLCLSDVVADTANKTVAPNDKIVVSSLMGETNKALAEQYAAYVETTLIDNAKVEYKFGSTIDTASLVNGCYAYVVKIGTQELVNGCIYIGTVSDVPVYNNVGENELKGYVKYWCNGSAIWSHNNDKVSVVDLSKNPVGNKQQGTYYKLAPTGNYNQISRFTLLPLYDKSVYESYLQQHANSKILFDLYIENKTATTTQLRVDTLASNGYASSDDSSEEGYFNVTLNQWTELSISLNRFVSNYETLGGVGNSVNYALFSVSGQWSTTEKCDDLVLYVGNFRIVSGD